MPKRILTDGRTRLWVIGVVGLALVTTLVAARVVTSENDGTAGKGAASDEDPNRRKAESNRSETSEGDSARQLETLDGELHADGTGGSVGKPTQTPAKADASSPVAQSGEPGLAFASLEDGLILESPISYYRRQEDVTQDRFEARRASPFVGGVSAVALYGGDLLMVATNHAELMRMHSDWKSVDTMLPFDTEDKEDLPFIGYGSLLIDGDRLLVSYRFGGTVGISEVDLRGWRLVRQQFYSGRFAGFPQLCLINDGQLALVSTEGVSIIDRSTFVEQHFVRLEGSPVGLACSAGTAWVTDSNAPRGWIVTAEGSVDATFAWEGRGSNALTYSASQGHFFGTDSVGNLVFRCEPATRSCEASEPIGDKPTGLLVDGDSIYITLELAGAVAIVGADDLSLIGRIQVPGSPRTLTVVPPP